MGTAQDWDLLQRSTRRSVVVAGANAEKRAAELRKQGVSVKLVTAANPGQWPPQGIETFDPWHLPLINTLVLLCSGCAATWAHHALVHENDRQQVKYGLWLAIGLGILFTTFQAYEYAHAHFAFAGNIYGASFFMATSCCNCKRA